MLSTETGTVEAFRARLASRRARVVVIGQGYVGLPLALQVARAGYEVVGLDRDEIRVARIGAGDSTVADVEPVELTALLATERYRVTADPAVLTDADCIIVGVPTPLTPERKPDLTYIRAAAEAIARHLPSAGSDRPRLVVLESTSPPGTTRGVILPILAATGAEVGRDIFLAFAPERIDPGNREYRIDNTPKLIGGVTAACQSVALAFYEQFMAQMRPVSSPEVAEMAKALENGFRFINIGFVNEVAILCDRLGVDVWEVVRAAASKPFAFMAHYPGPGVGGACIPVVPFYLSALAEELGVGATFIEAAGAVNDKMPEFVVDKLERLLAERGIDLAGGRVMVVGVTYKPNVADMRVSPAVAVLEQLVKRGAVTAYHDPFVAELKLGDGARLVSRPLAPDELARLDAVVVVTPHAAVDYRALAAACPLVFDTRNALAALERDNIIPL